MGNNSKQKKHHNKKKRDHSNQLRRNIQKRQKYSSVLNAITATAPQPAPLFIAPPLYSSTRNQIQENSIPPPVIQVPHQGAAIPIQIGQRDENLPVVVNGVEIPSLCGDINRKDPLEKALEYITRTQVQEDPTVGDTFPDTPHSTPESHKACVCVICDCFIIGTEEIVWLSKDAIVNKASYLSTNYYEINTNRGLPLPPVLRNQYLIDNDDNLKDLLLSPRAHRRGDTFMSCKCCATNIKRSQSKKPPRFGISNGWVIGYIPRSVVDDIDDLLASMISHVRFFSYVFTYIAGAHKAIKGHHTFFLNDPEHIGATFNYLRESGARKDVYVMLCGRMTPSQRDIARKKCKLDSEKYMKVLNWLIENHPSYRDVTAPQEAPSPVPLSGFSSTQNNTDQSNPSTANLEKSFEGS